MLKRKLKKVLFRRIEAVQRHDEMNVYWLRENGFFCLVNSPVPVAHGCSKWKQVLNIVFGQ